MRENHRRLYKIKSIYLMHVLGYSVQLSRAKKKLALDRVVCCSSDSDEETEERVSEGVKVSDSEVDTCDLDGTESGEIGEAKEASDEGDMDTDNSKEAESYVSGSRRREFSPDNDESEAADFGDHSAGSKLGDGGIKKARISGLYKPPTHDELQTLKETQNLFKSNLMRLQVLVYTFTFVDEILIPLCYGNSHGLVLWDFPPQAKVSPLSPRPSQTFRTLPYTSYYFPAPCKWHLGPQSSDHFKIHDSVWNSW